MEGDRLARTKGARKTRAAASAGAPGRVRRRRVLYIHGFDPRGPGPYHAMFVDEAARASSLAGTEVEVGPRRRGEDTAAQWTVCSGQGSDRVEADYTFLRWDDRVRARWSKQDIVLLGEVVAWTSRWSRLGFFAPARRQARALWLVMLSVPLAVGLYVLSALIVVGLLGFVAGALFHAVGLPYWAGVIPALASLLLAPAVWRWLEGTLNVCWLSRCFTYMQGRSVRPADDLAERDRAFAGAIGAALADPACDEVLVVGHSLGALHAVSALARALDADPGLGRDGRLAFLTLGQPIAIFTVQPEVEAFRRELAAVAGATQIPWLDVTSPSDPASACALDPFMHIDEPTPDRFIQRSPRFHVYLEPARFRTLRRDPISFHFQYLRAPDIAGGFDYFDFVAGPDRMMDHPWVKAAARAGGGG